MPRYFDAHSHLNFPQYDADREKVLLRMKSEGVWTITVGTDEKTSLESVQLAESHEGIFATVGIHPHDVATTTDTRAIEKLLGSRRVVAIGECGLDYYRRATDTEQKEKQKKLFEKQIELAIQHSFPLMIHGRPSSGSMDAYEDIIDVLASYDQQLSRKGNIHFFVGDRSIAKQFLNLGFTLSFDGPITFSHDYDDVVRFVPPDMILAETDAPFAAPTPYRGTRNEPGYVKDVIRALARIRGVDEEEIRRKTVENTCRVFNVLT